jgi:hypothetical protein
VSLQGKRDEGRTPRNRRRLWDLLCSTEALALAGSILIAVLVILLYR